MSHSIFYTFSACMVILCVAIVYFILAFPPQIDNNIALVMLPNLITVDGVLIGFFAAIFGFLLVREQDAVQNVKVILASLISSFAGFTLSIIGSFVSLANMGAKSLAQYGFIAPLSLTIAGIIIASFSLFLYSKLMSVQR